MNMTVERWPEILDRKLVVDDQEVRQPDDRADRFEIDFGVERKLCVKRRIDRVCAHGAKQQRIAIRRSFRDERRTDASASAALVLDHDRHAVLGLELLTEHARDQIGRAARAERHNKGNGLLRPSRLGARDRRGKARGGGINEKITSSHHDCSVRRRNPVSARARYRAEVSKSVPPATWQPDKALRANRGSK
jgi:hypothetical protein